jgi:actin-related protein
MYNDQGYLMQLLDAKSPRLFDRQKLEVQAEDVMRFKYKSDTKPKLVNKIDSEKYKTEKL